MYFVTFTLIAGGTGAILGGLARDVIALCIVGAILALITLTALTLTACRDPGIIPRRQERLDSDEIYDERALTIVREGPCLSRRRGQLYRISITFVHGRPQCRFFSLWYDLEVAKRLTISWFH